MNITSSLTNDVEVQALASALQADEAVERLVAYIQVPVGVLQDTVPAGWEHRTKTIVDPDWAPSDPPDPLEVPDTIVVDLTFQEYFLNYSVSEDGLTITAQIGHRIWPSPGRRQETSSVELYQWLQYFEMTTIQRNARNQLVFVKDNVVYVHHTISAKVGCFVDSGGHINLLKDSADVATLAAQFRTGVAPDSPVFPLPQDTTWLIALSNGPGDVSTVRKIFEVTFNTSGATSFDFPATGKEEGEYWLRQASFADMDAGGTLYKFRLINPEDAKLSVYTAL